MIYAVSRIGVNKKNCDDSVLINDVLINDDWHISKIKQIEKIFVADGVGGNKGGKEASKFVLSSIGNEDFSRCNKEQIRQKIISINEKLLEYANHTEDMQQMATTLTGIVYANKKYYMIHIGNTRLYVKQGSFLRQVSNDQTQYQRLLDMGMVREAEESNRSAIVGCMGGGSPKYVSTLEVAEIFETGMPDTMLLTSDGIHDYMDIDTIEDWVNSFKNKEDFENLIAESLSKGSEDDKSIIVAFGE